MNVMRGPTVTERKPTASPAVAPSIVDPLSDPRWDEFVRTHPAGLPFHLSAWVRALYRVFGQRPRFHALEAFDGQLVAAWPAMIVPNGLRRRRRVCLPFCHRAGPLVSTGDQVAMLFDAMATETNHFHDEPLETRDWPTGPPLPEGMQVDTSYSRHTIDLSVGGDALWSGLTKDLRYSIRRARRNGVTVRTGAGDRDLRAMPLAIWRCLEIACQRGARNYDLGRTDADSAGLNHFKDEWGGVRLELPYFYWPRPTGFNVGPPSGFKKMALGAYARHAPDGALQGMGRLLYRRLG